MKHPHHGYLTEPRWFTARATMSGEVVIGTLYITSILALGIAVNSIACLISLLIERTF